LKTQLRHKTQTCFAGMCIMVADDQDVIA
jgi:hypothetical protein